MQVAALLRGLCLALACAWPAVAPAKPPLVGTAHLEPLPGFASLAYAGGHWIIGGQPAETEAVLLVASNPRAYATVEAYGEDLTAPASLQFLDGQTGQVLDTVAVAAGTSAAALRSIPLVSRRVLVRAVGEVPAPGRITIARVLMPRQSAGVPHQLTSMMTPLLSYRGAIDPVRNALFGLSESLAMLQIAKPAQTVTCTAFLVAPDVLATAGHCLRDLADPALGTAWQPGPCANLGVLFLFLSDRTFPGMKAAHCLAIKVASRSEIALNMENSPVPRLDLGDAALLRIDPASVTGPDGPVRRPLPLRDVRDGALASVISFPQGDVARVSSDCAMEASLADLVPHRCATAPGSSGAPLLAYGAEGWQVVGLHVCCDGDAVGSSTRPELDDAAARLNLALRPSVLTALQQ